MNINNLFVAIYLTILLVEVNGIFSNRHFLPITRHHLNVINGYENRMNYTITSILATSTLITDKLTFFQTLIAGATSRTIAQTIMHPANTYKTMLQLKGKGHLVNITPERLLRGADAQFIMSLPHGAFYFFVIDAVKKHILHKLPEEIEFLGDFACSTISTFVCSIVSTPQMVLTDRLMAGVYPSFKTALVEIHRKDGMYGFYRGWWPALAQKIPSYGYVCRSVF